MPRILGAWTSGEREKPARRERERRSFLACAAPLVSASHELVSLCKVHVPPMTEALITVQNSLPHLVSWNYLSGLLTFSLANSV